MRFLLAPAGSRGDFQPLLALARGLLDAGHRVLLASGPNFASEAAAFGVPFHGFGLDTEKFIRETRLSMTPLRSSAELFRLAQSELAVAVDALVPLAREADVVIGAGAQIGAATAAEAAGVRYRYIAYTPQMFRSRWHVPFVFPVSEAPVVVNRMLWSVFRQAIRVLIGRPLSAKRRALGLPPVQDLERHLIFSEGTLLACDPELADVPADVALAHPALGSFHLRDERALSAEVVAFLEAGPPPVYVGFGSMADQDAEGTTRAIVEAARAAGTRAILSAGWGSLGKGRLAADVFVVGPLAHSALFPRCAAVVHHGGAGTMHAAARAGVPQLVVPHAFDQFRHAHAIHRSGLGPPGLPRTRMNSGRLGEALRLLLTETGFKARAAEVGRKMRARDGVARAVEILTQQPLRV